MTSWPSTSLERLICTLVGLAIWQWTVLTTLWIMLFPRKGLRREGSRLVREDNTGGYDG